MLGDLRVLDLGDELLLSCERVGLQELFNMIRRYKLGARRRAAQAHAGDGRAVADRPRGAARRGRRRRSAAPSTTTSRGGRRRARRCVLVATDLGVDVFCAAEATESVRATLIAAGATEVTEAAAELVRVESGRPRYGVDLDDERDPAGGRPQRARGLVHEGLLRRPGDGRAAVLPRQAEPPPARAEAQRAGRAGHAAAARREGGRARSRASPSPPSTGRSRWRSCAARPSPARRSRPATATSPPRSSSCRSRLARNSHCALL